MEFSGQTGFGYTTDGTTKTFSFGISNKLDESVAGLIGRINPQAALVILAGTACVCFGVDPKARKQLMSVCSKWLSAAA